jgi:hypothetical protein
MIAPALPKIFAATSNHAFVTTAAIPSALLIVERILVPKMSRLREQRVQLRIGLIRLTPSFSASSPCRP